MQGGDRMNGVGPAQRGGRNFRQTDGSDLSLGHQIGHGSHGLLHGNVRIQAVQVIEIDDIDTQPLQAFFAGCGNIFGSPADAHRTVLVSHETKFGGDQHILATVFQHPGNQGFIVSVAIHIGGVEKIDPQIQGLFHRGQRFFLICRTIGMGHAPAAQADGRHLKMIVSQTACVHRVSPLSWLRPVGIVRIASGLSSHAQPVYNTQNDVIHNNIIRYARRLRCSVLRTGSTISRLRLILFGENSEDSRVARMPGLSEMPQMHR